MTEHKLQGVRDLIVIAIEGLQLAIDSKYYYDVREHLDEVVDPMNHIEQRMYHLTGYGAFPDQAVKFELLRFQVVF